MIYLSKIVPKTAICIPCLYPFISHPSFIKKRAFTLLPIAFLIDLFAYLQNINKYMCYMCYTMLTFLNLKIYYSNTFLSCFFSIVRNLCILTRISVVSKCFTTHLCSWRTILWKRSPAVHFMGNSPPLRESEKVKNSQWNNFGNIKKGFDKSFQ